MQQTLTRVALIRDMDWYQSPETRCKYVHVRLDAASMRHTVSGNRSHSMPLTFNAIAASLLLTDLQYQVA